MVKREKFIEKAIKRHGNRYDYSKVEYVNSQTKVCIICPEHGEFWQEPAAHVRGNNCPICSRENKGKDRRKSVDDFIYKSIKVHGIKYNYSKTKYVNAKTKVCIICPKHGEFWQIPHNHLNGQGCPWCSGRNMDDELFIEKAREVHGGKYDYSKVEYVNSQAKVCIICPEHGEFWQVPTKHLYGRGCPKCGKVSMAQKQCVTVNEFKERAIQIHGDKYDYSKITYLSSMHDRVTIICPKHGEFTQLAYDHLNEHGCPSCGQIESKAEKELYEYICSLVGVENVEERNRSVLNKREIDILIPSLGLAFEYNGLRWHSEEFGKDRYYHLNKTIECKDKGIALYQIFEDEYLEHKDIVFNKIKHILGKSEDLPKIYARNCEVSEVDKEIAKEFLEKFHIQGYGKSTLFLSCKYNGQIVGIMGFRKVNDNGEWELTRFATDYNYICSGVGGKLFKYFVKEYDPFKVKSFADRRWSLRGENLYTKIGFRLEDILKPDYRYVNLQYSKERIHKFNFRKNTLNLKYNLPLTMTESEMTKELGYSKIWDCGLYRYVWEKKK